jgi:hypothetical protein
MCIQEPSRSLAVLAALLLSLSLLGGTLGLFAVATPEGSPSYLHTTRLA